jgi:hypothetical protein
MSVVTTNTPTELFRGFTHFLDPVAGRVTQSGLIDITTNSNLSFTNYSIFEATDLQTLMAS